MREIKILTLLVIMLGMGSVAKSAFAITSFNQMQCYATGSDVRFKGNRAGTVGTWYVEGRSIQVGRGSYAPTGVSTSRRYISSITTLPGLDGVPGFFFASSRGYLVKLPQSGHLPGPFILGGLLPLNPSLGVGTPYLPHIGEEILFDGDLQCVSLDSVY